jgi:hypothetical protein
VFLDGGDSNAWTIIGVVGLYCRRWTVWDSSFLGNTHIGHHSANAQLVRGVSPAVVSQGGNRYAVIVGQEAGASTNAPSGTTADNTWWLYMGAGAVDATLNIPAWVSGMTLRSGGCYHTDNANAYATFSGCYNEGGEAPAQFISPTCVVSGLWGTRNPYTTGNWYGGATCNVNFVGFVPGSVPGILADGQVWYDLATNKLKFRNSGVTTDIMFGTGALLSSSSTLGVGYATGAGAAVTQLTSKSTATPAINKVCGQITMHNAALAGGAKVSFVVTNSAVVATDTPIVAIASGGTANAYRASVTAISAGVSFTITVENITAGSLSEAPVINFSLFRAVAA